MTVTSKNSFTEDRNFEGVREFIRLLPKVELHAHLNGCIRERTLFELAKERKVTLNKHHFSEEKLTSYDHHMYNIRPRSLQDCFKIFGEIGTCVDDIPALSRITRETLEDFANHRVAYLELRSTPKQLLFKSGSSKLADKWSYCKTILDCMRDFETKDASRYASELSICQGELPRLPMVCRFIVAIDRTQPETAYEHAELAKSLVEEFGSQVVGVDLGGNPAKNHFKDFQGAFERARSYGMKITVHCAEVPCNDNDSSTKVAYDEAKSILDFAPDRLGHALLLPPSLQLQLRQKKIPVESCPTSNVMTLELAKQYSGNLLDGLKTHPQLESWILHKHPFSIGTDDPGVFNTNATKELLLMQKAFAFNKQELADIVLQSIDQAFCDIETRLQLQNRLKSRIETLLLG